MDYAKVDKAIEFLWRALPMSHADHERLADKFYAPERYEIPRLAALQEWWEAHERGTVVKEAARIVRDTGLVPGYTPPRSTRARTAVSA